MPKTDAADELSALVIEWMDDEADAQAALLLGSEFAPEVARVSKAEQLAYYRAQLFNPDGTPNIEGRNQLLPPDAPPGAAQDFEDLIKAVLGAGGDR